MKDYFEDDRPRDLSKYDSWTDDEISAEIARLEAEAKSKRAREEKSLDKGNKMAV